MELVDLTKSYGGTTVVENVSLTIESDEYLTILGPSGSGKSTLLRLIAGLEWPDSGTVLLGEKDIGHDLPHLRGLGFVQQKYALFPHLTIFENVAFGLRNRQINAFHDEIEVRHRTNDMLHLVGLDDLGGRMIGQISGGQKQRVSLARTLVAEPKICLLDEPLGALDANLREKMTLELRRIREVLGVTFVHATGNEMEAMAMGDRMVVLGGGRALQTGSPDEIYDLPSTVHVAQSVNAYNVLSGDVRSDMFHHADSVLPLPAGSSSAGYYAVRYGALDIENTQGKPVDGRGSIIAEFIASEFVGSKMIYFFRNIDGDILEVEQHLSISDPLSFKLGEPRRLTWSVDDVLTYDASGNLISSALRGLAA